MIATVRISLNIPDAKAKENLKRLDPELADAFTNYTRRQEVETALVEWIQDDIPRMLDEHATGDDVTAMGIMELGGMMVAAGGAVDGSRHTIHEHQPDEESHV